MGISASSAGFAYHQLEEPTVLWTGTDFGVRHTVPTNPFSRQKTMAWLDPATNCNGNNGTIFRNPSGASDRAAGPAQ